METDKKKSKKSEGEKSEGDENELAESVPMSSREQGLMLAYGAAERLRADLQAVRPAVLEGTVVKFRSHTAPARDMTYTYVALFVNAQWYLTGSERSPFPRTMNHVDFLALLGRSTISDIETAITWEGVA
jgi:hypothetical protein